MKTDTGAVMIRRDLFIDVMVDEIKGMFAGSDLEGSADVFAPYLAEGVLERLVAAEGRPPTA